IITIDGLRVEYPDGFGLARASNTTPVIVLRFEADTDAALQRIENDFRALLLAAVPNAKLPF
ncbi:MAG: phosphomannomutase/phosphoglucomutase, partial [Sulfuricellaceae bacterium]|nr:phosphomannomutase/phosphoglucomutase [Sulfuricellaceae bacterium]